jgi:homoserine acetyltransferase
VAKLNEGMQRGGIDVKHLEIETPNGHDAFLMDYDLITPPVREFLARP